MTALTTNNKISTFIQIYGDRVWDSIKKEFIDLSPQEIEFIKKYQHLLIDVEVPKKLLDLGIVTTVEQEQSLIKYLKSKTYDKQFQSLYLITSTACNLDCDYCFYRSNSSNSLKSRQNMPFSVAKKALLDFKKIVDHNVKDEDYWQQITFYGGEPLLNKSLLYSAIPYARELFGNNTNLVINTNGTLIDENDILLFKEYGVEVQISLDGDKDKHDLHRKTQTGEPTYDLVLSNMKRLIDNGIKVLPMITATDDNVDGFSKQIYNIVRELGIDDYAVNVLITNSFGTDDSYTRKLSEEMLKAYRDFGELATDYAFVELYKKLIGEDKSISKASCGSSRKITVFPNGEVYSCQAMEKVGINHMGCIDSNYIESPNWECWKSRSRFDIPECLECGAVISCGGGCATGSYNYNSSIYDIDRNNCEYTKKLFKKIHNI